MVKNTLTRGKIFPNVEEKITPDIGKKLPTNNSNPNITNSTAANGEDAAAADFKKLKEKGEEKMQAIRERMFELNFKEEFMEQLLKEYSVKKIDKKLDLLLERKNVQNPAGWLRTALKNDYRDEERERYDEEPADQESQTLRIDSRFRGNDIKGSGNDIKGSGNKISRGVLPYTPAPNVIASSDLSEHGNLNCRGTMHRALNQAEQIDNKSILSTEEARRRFHLLRQKLMVMNSP